MVPHDMWPKLEVGWLLKHHSFAQGIIEKGGKEILPMVRPYVLVVYLVQSERWLNVVYILIHGQRPVATGLGNTRLEDFWQGGLKKR